MLCTGLNIENLHWYLDNFPPISTIKKSKEMFLLQSFKLWKPRMATSISTFALGFQIWLFALGGRYFVLGMIIKAFKELMSKFQNRGWSLGGRPRRPYQMTLIVYLSGFYQIFYNTDCEHLGHKNPVKSNKPHFITEIWPISVYAFHILCISSPD